MKRNEHVHFLVLFTFDSMHFYKKGKWVDCDACLKGNVKRKKRRREKKAKERKRKSTCFVCSKKKNIVLNQQNDKQK